jgi:FAD/FMN-containing dehydrogenase
VTDFATLDALSTEELRERAFAKARDRRDIGFFWDLFTHLPTAPETEERELADLGAAIEDTIQLWRELTGHEYGEKEPLIRARFIDYLTTD